MKKILLIAAVALCTVACCCKNDGKECATKCCPKTETVEKCCPKADSCCAKAACETPCQKADSCCKKAECPKAECPAPAAE